MLIILAALTSQGQAVVVVQDTVPTPPRITQDHNPTKAVLLSLIPGAGQIYNGQAWKLPIIYAALGGVGYLTYNSYSEMKMLKDEYLRIGYNGSSTLPDYPGYPGSSIYNLYQSSNKNFQLFVLISVAAYGINLLDAYVFGHLYDFDDNDNLTLQVSPILTPNRTVATSVNLTFRF